MQPRRRENRCLNKPAARDFPPTFDPSSVKTLAYEGPDTARSSADVIAAFLEPCLFGWDGDPASTGSFSIPALPFWISHAMQRMTSIFS